MAIKMTKKRGNKKRIVKKHKSLRKNASGSASKSVFKTPAGEYIEAVGRRKVATARVRIYEGKGDFIVNDKLVGEYFINIVGAAAKFNKPFDLTGTKDKFGVTVKVSGSGVSSQLGAVIHGLSRALIKFNPEFRTFLKPEGLLTRDDRMKETRKIGMGGKARRKRQSPKR